MAHYPITAAVVILLLLRCRTAIAPLLLLCNSAVAPLSLCCRSAVAPLLSHLLLPRICSYYRLRYRLHCHSDVALLSLRCCYAITQLSLRCCSASASVATLPLLLLLLSLRCHYCYRYCCHSTVHSAIVLLSVRCHSASAAVTPDVAPAIAPAVTPLLSLGLFTVVASICRIRVTVFIGDCQACVSSSSERCFTLQKTVKVEAY